MSAWELLPLVRELLSRNPEDRYREAWELQWLLFSLNYTNALEDEGELAAAAEAARQDYPEWWRAA